MLKIFESMKQSAIINVQTKEKKETVLHLAADEGLSSYMERLIDLGSDLSIRDIDGNTVLHRLTMATVENPTQLKRHLDVIDAIFRRTVKWWCKKEKEAYPEDEKEEKYIILQREAILHLIYEIPNENRLSVFALSFNIGASAVISRLLMMRDVTMFKVSKDRYAVDVSWLMPRTNDNLKCSSRARKITPTEDEDHLDQKIPNNKEQVHHCNRKRPFTPNDKSRAKEDNTNKSLHLSGLEQLIITNTKNTATQVLDLLPVSEIEKYYTSVVTLALTVLMVIHTIYMSIFTYAGIKLLAKLRDDESAINPSDSKTMVLYIIVLIEPVVIVIHFVLSVLRYIRQRSKESGKTDIAFKLSTISTIMYRIVFGALTVAWIALSFVRYRYQDYVLAAALCLGWLFSLSFTRGWKPLHYFYSMLLNIIFTAFFRFLLVCMFVLLAFAFAFHVLFQVSTDVVRDYATLWDTLFLSFNLMTGKDVLFDGTLEDNMFAAGRTVTYIKVFYVIYIILSNIILLNLLIAMMNKSYSKILMKKEVIWRIDSMRLGVYIEKTFLCKSFRKKPIYQGKELQGNLVIPPALNC